MALDIFNPNKDLLLENWGKIVDEVSYLNPWDTRQELAWLCELASQSQMHLELGAYNGASTKVMCLANPRLKIMVLDTWDDPGTFEAFSAALKQEISERRVAFIRGTTDEGFQKLVGATFQTAFIDAAHLYDPVKRDIENCLQRVTGIISGHDYRHDIPDDGVNRAVHELLNPVSFPADSIWAYRVDAAPRRLYA